MDVFVSISTFQVDRSDDGPIGRQSDWWDTSVRTSSQQFVTRSDCNPIGWQSVCIEHVENCLGVEVKTSHGRVAIRSGENPIGQQSVQRSDLKCEIKVKCGAEVQADWVATRSGGNPIGQQSDRAVTLSWST
ncbi:hypothetical protein HanIR_Chr02g0056201 [Helianthus annuus]|nr:hypothetical protein HanIR_Chr02g0056201 [Helianthus annuus]